MTLGRLFSGITLLLALTLSCGELPSASVRPGGGINASQLETLLQKNRGKTLVLNFWAVYCPGCVPRTARLEREAGKPENKDVRFIFVNLDPPGSGQDYARTFMEGMVKNVLAGFGTEPDPRNFAKTFAPGWQAVLPAVFVIGPDGKLQSKCIGSVCEPQWRLSR